MGIIIDWRKVMVTVLPAALLVACAGHLNAASSGDATLTGTVTWDSDCAVHQRDVACGAVQPVYDVALTVLSPAGKTLALITPDAQGRYRLTLPAGAYRLELRVTRENEFTKDLPAEITIHPGQVVNFDVRIDNGMR